MLCKDCNAMLPTRVMLCYVCGAITPNNEETTTVSGVTSEMTVGLDEVKAATIDRMITGIRAIDQSFGGGMVPTGVALLTGNPGIGKTTVLLQACSLLTARMDKYAYYISSEQDKGEIKLTADRLAIPNMKQIRVLKDMGAGAGIDDKMIKDFPPCLIVLDSLSALVGKDKNEGLVIIKGYKKLSTKHKVPSLIINHMNKQGDMAGMLAYQHEVDTLLQFDRPDPESHDVHSMLKERFPGKKHDPEIEKMLSDLRVLIPWKNRYGATGAMFWMAMTATGLVDLPMTKEEKEKEAKEKLGAAYEVSGGRDATPPPAPVGDDGATAVDMPPLRKPKIKREIKVPGRKFDVPPAVPDEIVVNGQKLRRLKKKSDKGAEKSKAASAIEGEALKKKRAAVPRTKEGKKLAAKRRRTREQQAHA